MKKVLESPLIEKVTHSPQTSFSYDVHTCRKLDFPWHFHPEYQLNLVVRGKGKRLVGDKLEDFSEGDLILLGPNITHFWKYDPVYFKPQGNGKAIVIHFTAAFAGKDFFALPEARPISELLKKSFRGLRFYGPIQNELWPILEGMEALDSTGRLLQLLSALYKLSHAATYKELSRIGFSVAFDSGQIGRINAILNHIFTRFSDVSLESLAEKFFMTPASFSRYFKKHTGKTYMDVLKEIRLGHAERMLADSDENIARICFDCGYNNLANFNRQFKAALKKSPRDYRSSYRNLTKESFTEQNREKKAP